MRWAVRMIGDDGSSSWQHAPQFLDQPDKRRIADEHSMPEATMHFGFGDDAWGAVNQER